MAQWGAMRDLFLLLLVLVAAGYLLRKRGMVGPDAPKDLNQLVFNLALPALIFEALRRSELSWSMLAMPAVAWGTLALWLGLGWALARALRLSREATGGFLLAMAFANTTFFGYPIVEGLYGRHHLALAIFYDLLGATLAVNTVGMLIATAYGHGAASPGAIARRLALFPPVWALAAGLALHGVELPGFLTLVLDRLGAMTVPLIMLSLGMTLRFSSWREDLGLVGVVALGRLVLLPLITWGVVRALGLGLDYQQAAVMQAAMPTMFYAFTLAMAFGLRVNLVINAIMVTTLLSFATLPLWHRLLAP
jgi:hypothetical protein